MWSWSEKSFSFNELQEEEGIQLPGEDDDDDMPLRLSVSPTSSQPGTSAVVEEPKKKRGRKPKRVASPIAEEGSPPVQKVPK